MIQLSGPVIREGRALEDFETPFFDYLRAKFDEQLANNPTALLIEAGGPQQYVDEYGRVSAGEHPLAPEAKLTPAEASKRANEAGVRIDIPESGIAPSTLGMLIDRKLQQKVNQDAINRYQGGPGYLGSLAGFGASFGAGILDPLNIAASLIPVVGEERYTMMLAQAAGLLERSTIRAQVGALQGAIGTAVLEPLNYAAHQQLQDDYKLLDSLTNIAFGGVLGGGLHVVGGAAHDIAFGPPRAIEAPPAPKEKPATAPEAEGALAREIVARGQEPGVFGAAQTPTTRYGGMAAEQRLVTPAEASPFKFNDELTGASGGQSNHRLAMKVGDTEVGYIDYSVSGGQPHIQMIDVPEEFRRRGYGTALVQELQRAFPDREINWGVMTPEGSALYQSLRKVTVEDEGTKRLLAEREALTNQRDEMLRSGASDYDALNALHDRIRDIDGMLADQTSARTFIELATFQQRETALRTAVAQAAQGKVPDVESIIKPGNDPVRDAIEIAMRQQQPEAGLVVNVKASETAAEAIKQGLKSTELKDAEASLADAMQALQKGGGQGRTGISAGSINEVLRHEEHGATFRAMLEEVALERNKPIEKLTADDIRKAYPDEANAPLRAVLHRLLGGIKKGIREERFAAVAAADNTMETLVMVNNPQARKAPKLNYDKDSLLTAVAKLGGLETGDKLDLVGDKKQKMQFGGRNIFRKGGLDLDSMLEALHENGYIPPDRWEVDNGRHWFQEAIRDEANGTNRYYSINARQEVAWQRARDEASMSDEDFVGTLEDMAAADVERTPENLTNVDMVARASELDADAVERAALAAGEDDAAFMAAIKEILGEQGSEATQGSQAGAKAAPSAGRTTQEAADAALTHPELILADEQIKQAEALANAARAAGVCGL